MICRVGYTNTAGTSPTAFSLIQKAIDPNEVAQKPVPWLEYQKWVSAADER
jgi:hypothetical protein